MKGSPFVLNAGDVLGAPGSQHSHVLVGTLPGAQLPVAEIPVDADVRVEVLLEARGRTVIVEGTAEAEWRGECRRCLGPASGMMSVPFREVYSDDPVEGETYPLAGDRIDLRPMLMETLTLALPLAPLCSTDCAGPDPESHPVEIADELASPGRQREDDPWAALDQLKFDT